MRLKYPTNMVGTWRHGVGARRRGGRGWVGDRGELGVTVGLVARINVEAGRGVEDGRGEVAA